MLRLNRMTDYAILVLGALARRHGETLASGHLAAVTKLAQPTVAKVLKMLLAADLVETQRGVRGGYRLMKSLTQISLMDIVEAMEAQGYDIDTKQSLAYLRASYAAFDRRYYLQNNK